MTVYILYFITLAHYCSCQLVIANQKHINEHIEKMAIDIAEKFFSYHRCIIIVSDDDLLNQFNSPNLSVTIVKVKIDPSVNNTQDCLKILMPILEETFKIYCDGYIVQIRYPKCLFLSWHEHNMKPNIFRHYPKFLFLPVYPTLVNFGDDLLTLRETDISSNILVAELYGNNTDWSIILSTNNFYEYPTVKGRAPKIYLDNWHFEKGYTSNSNLYPDKIMDLRGKRIRVSSFLYRPYTNVCPPGGAEIDLISTFCKLHNCTVKVKSDGKFWGTIFDNNTGNGAMGLVYMDQADFGMGAMYLWQHEYHYLDFSPTYEKGAVTLLVPKPKRLAGWIVPFLPFNLHVWIAFFISIFISAMSLFIITQACVKFTRFSDQLRRKGQFLTLMDSVLRSLGMTVLQQPTSRLISDCPNRYLFTSFELSYLILAAIYSAELASFLTIPLYYPPIDTYHGFAQTHSLWLATHEAFIYSLLPIQDEEAQGLVETFRALPKDDLIKMAKKGVYSFGVERLSIGVIVEEGHLSPEIIQLYHLMKEELYWSLLITLLRKGSAYKHHFDKFIHRLNSHGLFALMINQAAHTDLTFSVQAAFQEALSGHTDSDPVVLELSHIQGVLYIYAIGLTISLISFVGEILF